MDRSSERGSAIIMLFVAVALFGMITYVFLQGSRGNTGMVISEGKKANDTRAQDYSNSINSTIKRLHLNGCEDNQISYETPTGENVNPLAPTDGSCHIFRTVKYQPGLATGGAWGGTDTTPNPFSFLDMNGQVRNAPVTNTGWISISGIDAVTPISVGVGTGTSPQYQICAEAGCYTVIRAWTSAASTITNGQFIQVRVTTGNSTNTPYTMVLNVGTYATTWTVTTGNKMICTALYNMGLMPEKIYKADVEYARKHISVGAVKAYQIWGAPISRMVSESSLTKSFFQPVANAWAEHLAYKEGAIETDNVFGRWLYNIFLPLHEVIGSILYPEDDEPEAILKEREAIKANK